MLGRGFFEILKQRLGASDPRIVLGVGARFIWIVAKEAGGRGLGHGGGAFLGPPCFERQIQQLRPSSDSGGEFPTEMALGRALC